MSGALAGAAWYLVDAVPAVGPFVLYGPEGRHAATVRRTRTGEQLVLTDGHGNHCQATVTATGNSSLTLAVTDLHTDPLPALTVTVVQALPKGERSDLAVDLLTEAGVDTIVPWQAERCIARWSGPKAQHGAEKWRMVAIQAAKQSRRAWVPTVRELAST
ncbi:MAG: 16S rRNA (uracil(1498)-N(3))-methyltransferase, partial [Actinomycetota bacterium]|nr:16S rRNA (uracil(1498)-N(3))-methyltransferase [Actinomycetota bacterium]